MGHGLLDSPPVLNGGDVRGGGQEETHGHVEHQGVFAEEIHRAEAEHPGRSGQPGLNVQRIRIQTKKKLNSGTFDLVKKGIS